MDMLGQTVLATAALDGVVKAAPLEVEVAALAALALLMAAIAVVVAVVLEALQQAMLEAQAEALTTCLLTLCLKCVMGLEVLLRNPTLLDTLQPIFKPWE